MHESPTESDEDTNFKALYIPWTKKKNCTSGPSVQSVAVLSVYKRKYCWHGAINTIRTLPHVGLRATFC